MSRQIPIFAEPPYEATFKESRRGSDSKSGATRSQHFQDSDGIERDFEDASRRFFEKNLNRRRHTERPDPTSWERDMDFSHPPPIFHDRPFGRRGSNPTSYKCSSPSWRRDHFDEMIQRMMNEDSDFDFPEKEFENFKVKTKREKFHGPEDARKANEKVSKSPSAPLSNGTKQKGEFQRQSSYPKTGSSYGIDENGFVDIPVVVCKDNNKEDGKKGSEKGRAGNGKAREESVAQEKVNEESHKSECMEKGNNEKENEKGKEKDNEKDNEKDKEEGKLTVKISVESAEDEGDTENEEKLKADEKTERQDVKSQEIRSGNSRENDEIAQGSQQSAPEKLSKIKTIEAELEKVLDKVKALKATGTADNRKEYLWLEEQLMRILMGLDAIEANGCKKIREARKEVVKRVQKGLNELENKYVPESK